MLPAINVYWHHKSHSWTRCFLYLSCPCPRTQMSSIFCSFRPVKKVFFLWKKHKNKIKWNLTYQLINQPIHPNPPRSSPLESNCRDAEVGCLDSQGKHPLRSFLAAAAEPYFSCSWESAAEPAGCFTNAQLASEPCRCQLFQWPDYVSKFTELTFESCPRVALQSTGISFGLEDLPFCVFYFNIEEWDRNGASTSTPWQIISGLLAKSSGV